MTQKERDKLMQQAKCGSPEQASAARAVFQHAADTQNAIEAQWSFKRLCKAIQREGNGKPLTAAQRARTALLIRTFPEKPGVVQVSIKRYAWLDAEPFYEGPLAQYWHVMSGAPRTV
jgi:hypothetical protein